MNKHAAVRYFVCVHGLDGLGFASFAKRCLVECNQLLSQRKAGLAAISIYKAANSRLGGSALFANLSLSQVAALLYFGNEYFPVHAPTITQFRCL